MACQIYLRRWTHPIIGILYIYIHTCTYLLYRLLSMILWLYSENMFRKPAVSYAKKVQGKPRKDFRLCGSIKTVLCNFYFGGFILFPLVDITGRCNSKQSHQTMAISLNNQYNPINYVIVSTTKNSSWAKIKSWYMYISMLRIYSILTAYNKPWLIFLTQSIREGRRAFPRQPVYCRTNLG